VNYVVHVTASIITTFALDEGETMTPNQMREAALEHLQDRCAHTPDALMIDAVKIIEVRDDEDRFEIASCDFTDRGE
jgi:hypothetical protein